MLSHRRCVKSQKAWFATAAPWSLSSTSFSISEERKTRTRCWSEACKVKLMIACLAKKTSSWSLKTKKKAAICLHLKTVEKVCPNASASRPWHTVVRNFRLSISLIKSRRWKETRAIQSQFQHQYLLIQGRSPSLMKDNQLGLVTRFWMVVRKSLREIDQNNQKEIPCLIRARRGSPLWGHHHSTLSRKAKLWQLKVSRSQDK